MKYMTLIGIVLAIAGCADVSSERYNPGTSEWYLVDSNEDLVYLENNISAEDPTYAQLVEFLELDDTEDYAVDYSACAIVHNNAELSGIKCGIILFDVYNENILYGCAVFDTTDKGIIYIDSTEGEDNRVRLYDNGYPTISGLYDDDEYVFEIPLIGSGTRFW